MVEKFNNRLYFLRFIPLLFALACRQESPSTAENPIAPKNAKAIPLTPTTVSFFNQKINLQELDLIERLDREILVNMYFQSSTHLALKKSRRYFPLIERILKEEKVPDDFKYLCVIESNLSNATSPVGAAGFWQFMPFTAPEYGLTITAEIDERLNVEKSTRAACKLIKENYDKFGDWINACAAYNRGAGGLAQDMRIQGVSHFFDTEMNNETARYVFRIIAMKLIMENPTAYGYHLAPNAGYPPYETRNITVSEPIDNLALWSKKQGTNRKTIRLLNPWILGNKLSRTSVPCVIELPNSSSQFTPFRP